MSCTSSPTGSEQQPFASCFFPSVQEDNFAVASNITEDNSPPFAPEALNYNATSHIYNDVRSNSPIPVLAALINAQWESPVDNGVISAIADCFDEHVDESYVQAYQSIEKDWMLFNSSSESLPIFDAETTEMFFEDADACVSPTWSTTAQLAEEEDIVLEDVSYDDTMHFEDIKEVMEEYETRSQADYIPTPYNDMLHQESMLQYWAFEHQRHEFIAHKFEQPPYPAERQQ